MKKNKKNLLYRLSMFPKVVDLQIKLNTAELKIEELEEIVKDELYKTFMEKLKEPTELARYRKENKNLRAKVKTLKSLLKGDK